MPAGTPALWGTIIPSHKVQTHIMAMLLLSSPMAFAPSKVESFAAPRSPALLLLEQVGRADDSCQTITQAKVRISRCQRERSIQARRPS